LKLFFSLFNRVSTGNDTGELILGGYDTTKYTGCLTYATVNVKGYWEFTADSVNLITGSTSTNIATSINAILDTGTTVAIAAPTYYANLIFSILGATQDPTTGLVRER
jgi:saccharopepsin